MRMARWMTVTAVLLFAAGLSRDVIDKWIDATVLPPLLSETSVEVRDRNGDLLRVYTVADGRWRLAVSPAQVDPGFVSMLIAYEDKRFADHSGVDPRAALRAVAQALRAGEVVSGGSTLTMQVARLLEDSGTGQLSGKLRQIRVALALERALTKDQILALYLTHAPYGGNIEGIRAATLTWFGKEPHRLTPAESALLVALPQSPVARRPDRHPEAARAARDRVLDRVARAGALDRDEARAAQGDLVPRARRAFPALAPHMADRALAEAPTLSTHHLTLDATLQHKLERLARDATRGLPPETSVAVVLADHQTGEILASVGSAGYNARGTRQGFVDMTSALRSPGSTLKPFIYAMAFDRGLAHPQTLIDDRPVAFGSYAPRNFDGAFRGELTITDALRQSLNIPVVLLLDEIGPAHLMNLMRRAGVSPVLPGDQAGLAIGLGGLGVTLTDMTQLYAALARGGVAVPLRWRADEAAPMTGRRIFDRAAAWQVSDILAGLAPPAGAPRGALAYKTGTSYGHRDAWALGFDGRHVAGVWIGRPDGTPVPGAFGGDLAAPILFEAFQRLRDEVTPLAPPPPETLMVSTARLPQPLRRFHGRNAAFEPASDAPKLIFPPDGARLALGSGNLPVKLRDGTPPFIWLANGVPVLTGSHRREVALPGLTAGFSQVSVIDARGRAARVSIRID
ncbi:penicillin-binding protein 1C [Roseovarius sp. SCSIO 43702]|uniref:penicillin-binding protein 1C n=1 Tax=Roseovarius sp. SCSIO 43702 TaxID=2823043 RepID=UPI001C7355E6|nr:penicillin-binding protein 1C [Roseovarius sp. SCSIO 43702]QYX56963.1 penicillin-binding protein 1C [Roseovarius sp. SCSIO 43702]